MEENSENLVRITSKIMRIQRKSENPEKKSNSGIKKRKGNSLQGETRRNLILRIRQNSK